MQPVAPHAIKDAWFNPSIAPASTRGNAVVAPVMQALEQHGRKRALRTQDRSTLHKVMIPVVANLIHHYLIGSPGAGIPVPRSNRDEALGGKGARYQPFVFPRSWPKMFDTLCELGFAEQRIGQYSSIPGKSKRTTIRAGAKLIELVQAHKVTVEDLCVGDTEEIIILKRPKRGHRDEGERIGYDDDDTTRRYREELRAINGWLASADISFDAATAGYDQSVNVQARRLYRSFTMGSFEKGGRLFGGFWENLPKGVRLRGISIEGEHVIGLDYSQLNPRLAYSLAKARPLPGDAYSLPGLENCRDGVKKVFNAMLFDNGPRKSFPMLKGVLSAAGIGHTLMFLESKIMTAVLHRCQKREIVALPVFDCVVVKASAAATAKAIMQREFTSVAGLDVEVREEVDPTLL